MRDWMGPTEWEIEWDEGRGHVIRKIDRKIMGNDGHFYQIMMEKNQQ